MTGASDQFRLADTDLNVHPYPAAPGSQSVSKSYAGLKPVELEAVTAVQI